MSDIDSNVADMNRLLKVCATFDAESQTAKVLDAEIDRLSDVIEAALKAETPDLVTQVAMQFAGSSWDGYNVEDRQFVRDDTERALAYLAGTGRLIPDGGMALTAEQVEDVRAAREALRGYRNFDVYARSHVNRLIEAVDALFPATEPAEEVKCTICDLSESAGHHFDYDHPFTTELGPFDDEGNERPAPAEPAEEETKAEGAASHCWDMESYAAGSNAGFDEAMRQHSGVDIDDEITEPWSRTEFAVMSEVGDRVFEIDWDRGGTEEALDCIVGGRLVTRDVYYGAWRLVDAEPTSSPVVPALTETEWQTLDAVPADVRTVRDKSGTEWRRRKNGGWKWGLSTGGWSKVARPSDFDEYAPFVAAEEGRA